MKTILVVGGSSGIGAELIRLNRSDTEIINFSRTAPESADSIKHYELDAIQDELPELEKLDGLIYCPGSINLKPFKSLTEEDLENDFKINVTGAFRIIRKYLPLLQESSSASVVLFSSVAAVTGMPFHTSIAASKGAVEAMVRSLAAELAPKVRVNCVAPSLSDTPLATRLLRSEKQRESAASRHPMQRIGTATDQAKAANFLLSESSSWITGQVIRVDGGMSSIKL
jgi:NAD(P)-dependent dehydrogenase (short-subunit alcohol dehydrogenase family)